MLFFIGVKRGKIRFSREFLTTFRSILSLFFQYLNPGLSKLSLVLSSSSCLVNKLIKKNPIAGTRNQRSSAKIIRGHFIAS